MRTDFFLLSLICLLAVSCSVQEFDAPDKGTTHKHVVYAYLESYADSDTKTYIDESLKVFWDKDDRISFFPESNCNREYRFEGNSGDKSGKFSEVYPDDFWFGEDIAYACAVYPHNPSTKLDENNNILTLTLPEKQTYRKGSFGLGVNAMVSTAKTKDDPLVFKNLCGYLVLKFYGEGIFVSSIRLEGNNDEKLSGTATAELAVGKIPEIKMATTDKANTSVTLSCDKVELGMDKENATVFWMVVPPTTFKEGFKLTVTGVDGKEFVKETSKELSIARNTLLRIAPIEVVFK